VIELQDLLDRGAGGVRATFDATDVRRSVDRRRRRRHVALRAAGVLLVAVAVAGAFALRTAGDDTPVGPTTTTIEDAFGRDELEGLWLATTVTGTAADDLVPQVPRLEFDGDDVRLTLGCDEFHASFEVDGDLLSTDREGGTLGCSALGRRLGRLFVEGLPVRRITPDRFEVTDDSGTFVFDRFDALRPPASLDGTWEIRGISRVRFESGGEAFFDQCPAATGTWAKVDGRVSVSAPDLPADCPNERAFSDLSDVRMTPEGDQLVTEQYAFPALEDPHSCRFGPPDPYVETTTVLPDQVRRHGPDPQWIVPVDPDAGVHVVVTVRPADDVVLDRVEVELRTGRQDLVARWDGEVDGDRPVTVPVDWDGTRDGEPLGPGRYHLFARALVSRTSCGAGPGEQTSGLGYFRVG
jgi:hypothetical protein